MFESGTFSKDVAIERFVNHPEVKEMLESVKPKMKTDKNATELKHLEVLTILDHVIESLSIQGMQGHNVLRLEKAVKLIESSEQPNE